MKIVIISLFICSFAWSNDQAKLLAGLDSKTDVIADNYEAGPYLIYDCEEKHWTCVTEPYFKECGEKRNRESASEFVYKLCAPIGVFPTKKSCFQRQLFLTTQNHGERFCIKDEWKQKAIK